MLLTPLTAGSPIFLEIETPHFEFSFHTLGGIKGESFC